MLGGGDVELGMRHAAIVIEIVVGAEPFPSEIAPGPERGILDRRAALAALAVTVEQRKARTLWLRILLERKPAVAVPVETAEGLVRVLPELGHVRRGVLLGAHGRAVCGGAEACRFRFVQLILRDLAV